MTQIPDYARGYEDFDGKIGRTFSESEPSWPEENRARDGAPNVIVVLLDDMGYSDIGPFGSEIPTPNLDRVAAEGFALTNYHTTPVCSPARAAVLTGLNPHRAGFAHVANSDPGFPGLRLELGDDVASLPEILRGAGYATFGVGKWHLTRDALLNAGADKSSWPIQRGFDHYYGSLEALNSFFHPNQLVRDNTVIQREQTPEGYYLTDDYTDNALDYIKALRAADADKPFFLYFAHTAMHGPLGAKNSDIDNHRGRYDGGWDEIRRARHARQIELGIIPAGTPLPEAEGKLGASIPEWESLDEETRSIYARYQEVYAAMVDNVDQSLGRILGLLDELGERENTIVVFTSDNGGTAEGGPEGTRSYFSRFAHVPGLPSTWEADVDVDPSFIGGPRSMAHYPEGWGNASNTPFRFYKGQTYAGGIRVPLLISWPDGLGAGGKDQTDTADSRIRNQYQFVTDLTPTILDLTGVDHPGVRNNKPSKQPDGTSFGPVLRDGDHASTHPEQYSELGGNRGYYADGWKIITNHRPGTPYEDGEWELYHVATDVNELHNVAEEHPDVLRDLAAKWERAAWENTVFPLPDHSPAGARRRPSEQRLSRPVTLLPGTPKLERYRSSKLTQLRSFTVEISVDWSEGDAGVLVSHGDQGGGYVVYVADDGTLRLTVNEYGRLHEVSAGSLSPGENSVLLSSESQPEFRTNWSLQVDGSDQAPAELENLWAFVGMAPFSGIDVGVNRGGPVHWGIYEEHGSYRYSGDLHSVRYVPGERAPYSPEVLAELAKDAADAFD
ncbi:MAG TPA: arylsulfatase [Candidatus Corynebacterium avicola]|uniref:Arylsulfatase n=1 Tax=Candidatus Corynebacterium avicola TaxID=2838527 RepID=A0A9D1RSE8_9CORY|nr:arylsulfatase [Candidatus Corynebacterium avicola]